MLFIVWFLDGKRRKQVALMEKARLDVLRKQVQASVDSAGSLAFGMVLLNARNFLRRGRFFPYEELRDANELKVSQRHSFSASFIAHHSPMTLART